MPTESNWIALVREDLNDYLVGAQMDALSSVALAAGQSDPFDNVMPDVAARIRAEVRACRNNRVSKLANSVPRDLKSIACYLTIEAMSARLSIALELSADQKKQCDEARKYLARIAKCEVPIGQPTDPEIVDDVQRAGSIVVSDQKQSTTQRGRIGSRDRLSGF